MAAACPALVRPYTEGGMKRDFIVWWIAFLLTVFQGRILVIVWDVSQYVASMLSPLLLAKPVICPGVFWGIGTAVGVSLLLIAHDAAVPRHVADLTPGVLGCVYN